MVRIAGSASQKASESRDIRRSDFVSGVDDALSESSRIITGCLKPTPLSMVNPLAGIVPPDVQRKIACAVEKQYQNNDSRHPLYHYNMPPAA
ncbi:unnamed protein product [Arctia plantaginis]|uniref:Uncharacterized protein n=1 Tax=Arctia plantaginis TaxID=874455 RepID=A0A8S1AZI5_ARCPL|nr:unnamed protein product [Arctia plantaginis]